MLWLAAQGISGLRPLGLRFGALVVDGGGGLFLLCSGCQVLLWGRVTGVSQAVAFAVPACKVLGLRVLDSEFNNKDFGARDHSVVGTFVA